MDPTDRTGAGAESRLRWGLGSGKGSGVFPGLWRAVVGWMAALGAAGAAGESALPLRNHDVVALVGGATLVAADRDGALETLLTLAHGGRRVRFRNLAWEGDTVFARPREVNFPDTLEQLGAVGATVALVQFGAMEAMDEGRDWVAFREAYGRLLDEVRARVRRTVVVTPVPFEIKAPPLPDLAARNDVLGRYAAVARDLAAVRGLAIVDVFGAWAGRAPGVGWTTDGRELTGKGHEAMAAAWVGAMGEVAWAERAWEPSFWAREDIRAVREAVQAKNGLWFDAWRPMNWAFLGGDRMDQPSSRDHLDPTLRWFPIEMARYGPLIEEAEARVASRAAQVREEAR